MANKTKNEMLNQLAKLMETYGAHHVLEGLGEAITMSSTMVQTVSQERDLLKAAAHIESARKIVDNLNDEADVVGGCEVAADYALEVDA